MINPAVRALSGKMRSHRGQRECPSTCHVTYCSALPPNQGALSRSVGVGPGWTSDRVCDSFPEERHGICSYLCQQFSFYVCFWRTKEKRAQGIAGSACRGYKEDGKHFHVHLLCQWEHSLPPVCSSSEHHVGDSR